MIDYELIGSRLKEARRTAGLTQEELAEQVFLSTVYLSRIENGKVFPTLETLSNLCGALGVSLGWLFSGIEVEKEDYGNEQLKRVVVVQLGLGHRAVLLEPLDNTFVSFCCSHVITAVLEHRGCIPDDMRNRSTEPMPPPSST